MEIEERQRAAKGAAVSRLLEKILKALRAFRRRWGIKFLAVDIGKNTAVIFVRSRFGNRVELPAGSGAEFGVEIILQQREFLNRILDGSCRWSGHPRIIVVDAVDVKCISARANPADHWCGGCKTDGIR